MGVRPNRVTEEVNQGGQPRWPPLILAAGRPQALGHVVWRNLLCLPSTEVRRHRPLQSKASASRSLDKEMTVLGNGTPVVRLGFNPASPDGCSVTRACDLKFPELSFPFLCVLVQQCSSYLTHFTRLLRGKMMLRVLSYQVVLLMVRAHE